MILWGTSSPQIENYAVSKKSAMCSEYLRIRIPCLFAYCLIVDGARFIFSEISKEMSPCFARFTSISWLTFCRRPDLKSVRVPLEIREMVVKPMPYNFAMLFRGIPSLRQVSTSCLIEVTYLLIVYFLVSCCRCLCYKRVSTTCQEQNVRQPKICSLWLGARCHTTQIP